MRPFQISKHTLLCITENSLSYLTASVPTYTLYAKIILNKNTITCWYHWVNKLQIFATSWSFPRTENYTMLSESISETYEHLASPSLREENAIGGTSELLNQSQTARQQCCVSKNLLNKNFPNCITILPTHWYAWRKITSSNQIWIRDALLIILK